MTRITQAVVLAGGKGTRLGDLTTETPKPLLPVGGRPFLGWVIDNLRRHGVSDVILAVGYRAEAFSWWLRTYEVEELRVSIFVEEEPLDTGGALTRLGGRLQEAVFVVNGDTIFDVSLGQIALLLESDDVDAAIGLRPVPDTARYGRVDLEERTVVRFAEKSRVGPGLISGGIYAMRASLFEGREAPLSIERDVLPELVAEGRVVGLPSDGFFVDIGVPETYREAQRSVPDWWERAAEL